MTPKGEPRPDYVKCVRRADGARTWCGFEVTPTYGWTFVDVTHAAENGRRRGRLLACPLCVKVIIEALHLMRNREVLGRYTLEEVIAALESAEAE